MGFDFWLGTWRGTWARDGAPGEATNYVTSEYGGHVIHERFTSQGFNGMSVSVFDEPEGVWKQTWVDDAGSYLDFTGGWDGDAMILEREAIDDDGLFRQRMVWHNIRPDGFEWLWQRSTDGDNWTTRWRIDYKRAA